MNSHLRKYIIAAAAIITIIAAAAVLLPRSGYYLTLRNRDTGEVYARYKMSEGDRFSVTFIHSVNKYPLTDTYEIETKRSMWRRRPIAPLAQACRRSSTPAKRLTRSMWTA